MKRATVELDDVVYWVRSIGPEGKDRVPMRYKGRLTRHTDEGNAGDVQVRPLAAGDGPYTVTLAADTIEDEEGNALWPNG